MKEIWKPVPSLRGYFSVSSFGRVRSEARRVRFVNVQGQEHWRKKRSKIMATHPQNGGYLVVHPSIDGVKKIRTVHSLVAEAFIGQRPCGADVCHNDGTRTNNRPGNLRYDTRSNNHLDSHKHGTVLPRCTGAKVTPTEVHKIRRLLRTRTARQVADLLGLSYELVRKLKTGKTWRHLKG